MTSMDCIDFDQYCGLTSGPVRKADRVGQRLRTGRLMGGDGEGHNHLGEGEAGEGRPLGEGEAGGAWWWVRCVVVCG